MTAKIENRRDAQAGHGAAALAKLAAAVLGTVDLSTCDGCDECGLRCEAGVKLSQGEFEAVRQYILGSEDRDYIQRVRAQSKEVELGDGVSVRLCPYRDMELHRCAIYPVRPLVCRLMGHVEWLPCPIARVRRVAPTPLALELMKEYSQHTRRTFQEWEALLPTPVPPSNG
ncbi:MAG: YkgJ family cysteine cluster protein [Chthonomonadales bacterium]